MESIQLLVQGIPATAAELPELKDGGQSLEGAEVAGFTSLLVSLLSPSQPLPEALAVMPVKPEGSGQAADKSAAFPLIRPGSDMAGSLISVARIFPALDTVPVKGDNTVQAAPAEEVAVQQVLPEASILLRMVPVNQGKASETGFKLETVPATGNGHQSDMKEGPVQIVSVSLSAIDDGEVVLPLQLPTGEQVTLLLKDLPGDDSVTRATGQDRKVLIATPAKSSHETASLGTPAASGDVIRVILQVKPSPAPRELSDATGESRKESGDGIRVILQVKPSTPHLAETRQTEPLPATGDGNRVVLQAKPSMPFPVETRQAGLATVSVDAAPELPSARPAVFTVQTPEIEQHRGETVKAAGKTGSTGVTATTAAEPLPATNQVMDVRARAVPEIRVLNQSSRPVEIVMQSEPANGQAAVESVGRATGEKSTVMETGGTEAALPGKPAKGVLLADAVTGKETVSTVTPPVTDLSGKASEVAATTKPEVSADNLIDQVMQKISPANRNIPSEVTVKLQPEHLGNLQMKVAVEGDQVAVKIHVESPLAKQMLENNLGQLRESLGSVGLRMDSISVSLGMNTGWERGHNPLWQDGRGHNGYPALHREAEPRRQEQFVSTPRAYPVKIDRLLDMTI